MNFLFKKEVYSLYCPNLSLRYILFYKKTVTLYGIGSHVYHLS